MLVSLCYRIAFGSANQVAFQHRAVSWNAFLVFRLSSSFEFGQQGSINDNFRSETVLHWLENQRQLWH
jgi:hypothetical protein